MPIRFEIYRGGNRVNQFTPVAAMAMGPENVPLPADVSFRDGLLIVSRGDDHPTGVALLWEVAGFGTIHLETTRLVPRLKPYNLNVELARGRLMKVVQKQEDWNLFDFPKAEKFAQRFKDSQALLADALGKQDEPVVAAKLADESLSISVDLSEQLAVFHGELFINRRRASSSFVRHIFGCKVDPTIANQKYRDILSSQFDYAVLPIPWKLVQPQEQSFETGITDEWVDLLARKRMPIVGGPLIDFSEGQVPDWMYIWEHDFDTVRDLAYEYVQKIVGRYRKNISVWNVVAGLHTNSVFTLSFEQIIELTRLLVTQVKTMIPTAKTLVTIKYPYGEYHARSRASVPPMLYAEMVAQAGIGFEAFGLEAEMGVAAPGMYARDLFQFSSMLDHFTTLGKLLFLTSVGVPSRATPDPQDASDGKLDPTAGGIWKRPWDPELQAQWLNDAYRIALSKPFVESIAWSNLSDLRPSLPGGGLLDDMFKPKPAFAKLQEMREQVHGWQRK